MIIWEKSHSLVLDIYQATFKFPKAELYALTSQIRRAVFSIPANIAEGCVKSQQTFINHLSIAQGSLEEVKYYLILSQDLGYLPARSAEVLYERCEEIGKMTFAFSKKLKADS